MTEAAHHPLFGPVPPHCVPVLMSAAQTLIDSGLPAASLWREIAQHILATQTDPSDPRTPPTVQDLSEVAAALKSSRLVTQAPFTAFLTMDVVTSDLTQPERRLSAWVLAAALLRHALDPGENAIAAGLGAMRGLRKTFPAAFAKLPPLPEDPQHLYRVLRSYVEDHTTPKRAADHVQSLRRLLRAALTERPSIVRDVGARTRTAPPKVLPPHSLEEVLDFGDALVLDDEDLAGPVDLQRADQVRTTHPVKAPENRDNIAPRPVAELQAAIAGRAAARRDLSLLAEPDPLSPFEVQQVVHWLKTAQEHPGWSPVLCDLAFGPAAQNADHAIWAQDPTTGAVGLVLTPPLPAFDALIEENRPPNALHLPAPEMLTAPPDAGADDADTRRAALRALRGSLTRPLTAGRILRYKADWLRRAGADPAVIGFLVGTDPRVCAQMHYTSVPQAGLLAWHGRFLAALGLTLPPPASASRPPDASYGATLHLPLPLLAHVFAEARRDVRDAQRSNTRAFVQVAQAHNTYPAPVIRNGVTCDQRTLMLHPSQTHWRFRMRGTWHGLKKRGMR